MVTLALVLAAGDPVGDARPDRQQITSLDIVEVAEVMGPAISPDGRRVAYRVSRPSVDQNETLLEWFVVDVTGGTPVRVAFGGLGRFDGAGLITESAPVWDRDSAGLRFLAFDGKAVALWHWREGGSALKEIEHEADLIDFSVSPDGKELRFNTGATRAAITAAEEAAYRSGVLVDGSVDLSQSAAGGYIEDGKRLMQRFSGSWFDRKRLLWDAPVTEHRMAISDAIDGPQTTSMLVNGVQGAVVSHPIGGLASLVGGSTVRIDVVRADGGTVSCRVGPCGTGNIAALGWAPDGRSLLLFERAGSGRERIWSWKVGKNVPRPFATTDGAPRVAGKPPRCAIGLGELVCAEKLPLVPPRMVAIDIADGTRRVLADPNERLARRIRARAEAIALPDSNTGMLLLPELRDRPVPIVVNNYYCGGFLKGGTGEELPMLPLVESGIGILCIDPVRGPEGGGMEGTYGRALTLAIDAIDALAARGIADPEKVGISGFSYGSGVALWSLRHSKRFAAATIGTGQISPYYYWSNALPDRGFVDTLRSYWNVSDPDRDPARWKIASAVWDAQSINTPLLMQLPDAETPWTAELHTRLKTAGKAVDLFVFPDELHNKYQPRHKLAVYERNLDWFRFWLRGVEDPASGKSSQYIRWRSYRAGQPLPAPAR